MYNNNYTVGNEEITLIGIKGLGKIESSKK